MARNTGMTRPMREETARRAFSFRMFGEVVSELRRVTWPTRHETMRLTIMVVAVAVAVGIFLGLVDLAFSRIFDEILRN